MKGLNLLWKLVKNLDTEKMSSQFIKLCLGYSLYLLIECLQSLCNCSFKTRLQPWSWTISPTIELCKICSVKCKKLLIYLQLPTNILCNVFCEISFFFFLDQRNVCVFLAQIFTLSECVRYYSSSPSCLRQNRLNRGIQNWYISNCISLLHVHLKSYQMCYREYLCTLTGQKMCKDHHSLGTTIKTLLLET